MQLRAISQFLWRGHAYEIGERFDCSEVAIAKRLISEGHAQEAHGSGSTPDHKPEPAASKTITPTTTNSDGAEMPKVLPVASKKQVAKTKKR